MFDDAKHCAPRTMPPESARAPVTLAAREIDLADHTLANQPLVVRLQNLTHKLMSGDTTETVVSALEFEVRVAQPGATQSDQRIAFAAAGLRTLDDTDTALVELNS